MIRISPTAAFWFLLGLATIVFLFVFSEILTPFALGIVIAYLLDPLVARMQKAGVNRGVASFCVVFILTVLMLAAAAVILPALINQLIQLIESLPRYVATVRDYIETNLYRWLDPIRGYLQPPAGAPGQPTGEAPADLPKQITDTIVPWAVTQLQTLLAGGIAWVQSIVLLFVTPVVTFFLLKDWDDLIASVNRALPLKQADTIRELASEIDWTISSYLRGQLTVLLILSAFFMVSLTIVGLNYGLLIGLVAGLISFVPYLGTFTGFVLSGSVAFLQFYPDWFSIMLVISIFVFGQIVESNVLTPKIVGDSVKLHPVWLIFALFAFGYLFGFTGLIVAVPVAAIVGVLVRYGMRRYYQSAAYRGDPTAIPEAPPQRPEKVLHE